jgi:hypothetical protein
VPSSGFSKTARKQAEQILSHSPFRKSPKRGFAPLQGVLHRIGQWIGDALRPAWHVVYRDLIHKLIIGPLHSIFGAYDWLALAAVVLVIGVLIGALLIRRRTRIAATAALATVTVLPSERPEELEAQADLAEAGGDHDAAVRLRFRAGLSRLEALGAIPSRDTTTTHQLRNSLKSSTFDALADTHETVAYAGVQATPGDSAAARERWPGLVSDIRARVQAKARAA